MVEQGPPSEQEEVRRRPVGAESSPGGVGSPLGSETLETQPLPALDALLQTNFMETLPGIRPIVGPHAEQHMAHGDDEVHSFDTISVYDFILMRKGHETDTGRAVQEEIPEPSVPTALVPQGGSYVSRNLPMFQLESDESTDPQRIQAVLQPRQASSGPAGFVHLKSDQALDQSKFSEVGVWGFVAAPSGATGTVGLYSYAGSSHNATPHNHELTLDPWLHVLEMPSVGFRIGHVRDPVSDQDAATKKYVDGLSYAGHTLLDGSLHTDTLAGAVVDGDVAIGNATPKWSRLAISVPAANVRNALGVDNGELRPSWKAALDATNPVNAGGAASPGTSLIFSHRDHVHAVAASHSGSAHHTALTIGADAAHSLAAQVLSAVLAANGQTGHMSGAMFDKLDGIEATADVTDAANVAGAGAVMDSDISPGEGFLRKTGAGTYTAHKSNLAAAAAPDANEDSADGYSVGSLWIDTTNDNMYVCVDATAAAAVWLHLNAAAAAHDHTVADGSGVLTNDEHDGYSEYAEIAIPPAPAASKGRLFTPLLTTNDSLSPGTDETGLFYRRNDGLMVKLSDDFPYSTKMRHVWDGHYGDSDEPLLENSWVNYGWDYNIGAFTKDFLGCVWVQGMIKSGTIGATAFTMPEGYWPSGRTILPTISNGVFGTLQYLSDGQVNPSFGNNTYVSLCRMAFPETNRITWHDVGSGGGEPAFENSWVNYGGVYDTAAFAKDAIGRVWVKGFVKSGGDNTVVFTLPAGYRPTADIYVASVSDNNVIAGLKVLADGSVKVDLLGAGTNAWASISIVFTADGAGPGWTAATFQNSWVNFGGAWDTAAYYKDACGIVHIKGLIKSGTIGAVPAFTLPVGYRPKQRHLFAAFSNGALGGMRVNSLGEVEAMAGNNGSFSVHCSFVAEQ